MGIRVTRHRFAAANRFAAPVPADELSTGGGAICPQPTSRLNAVMGLPSDVWPQTEDCLWLSIAAPDEPGLPRPVIVFLHGGGFGTGSGLSAWYDGSSLAAEQDVIVLSVNYRLGPFGYLVLPGVSSGNLGLLDQLAALQWTQRHIAQFGGDPTNVTVMGQSAGAISIDAMLELRDPQRPLFRRAIMQSGPAELTLRHRAAAEVDGARFAAHLGADPRSATADALLAAFGATAADHTARAGDPVSPAFTLTRGAEAIPQEVQRARLDDLDVVVGYNADELSAFGIDDPARTEQRFGEPISRRAAELQQLGATVHRYRFDWRPTSRFGATHCLELPLLLGDEQAWSGAPMLGATPWAEVAERGRRWRAAWAQFARSGTFADPT